MMSSSPIGIEDKLKNLELKIVRLEGEQHVDRVVHRESELTMLRLDLKRLQLELRNL